MYSNLVIIIVCIRFYCVHMVLLCAYGSIQVPGNFHVSTHAAHQQPTQGDMRHVVHTLRFGQEPANDTDIKGSFNPMENVAKSSTRKYINE